METVDEALEMLDVNIEELMSMTSNQLVFGPKEIWILDKNELVLKTYFDRIEDLIKGEVKS